VPLYLLGKAAAQEADTIFNGEGGDQLFGGWANKPMIAAELHGDAAYDRLGAYLETYHRFHGFEDQLYTPAARSTLEGLDAADWVRPYLERHEFTTLLHRLRAANLWLKGAQNIAPRAAQLAEVHGLTMHAPFFDRALTEWSFTLPPEWFLQGACEKYILKRVAERFLPADVVWREKQGMGAPTTDWCLGGLKREVGRWLAPRRIKERGWLDPAYVDRLRHGEDQPGEYRRRRVGERLWALLLLHVWCAGQDPPVTWPALEVETAPEPAHVAWWGDRMINPFTLSQAAWLRITTTP
jgi:asparagine synthase (glutamine-hydrolysing)